jgi:dihydrofolate reductase
MDIKLIWAQARNRVIGKSGGMPWHLPQDLAHLKALTMGCPVIMGRKTWESLPPRFRPLPGRRNIVLTRSSSWHEDGAQAAQNIHEALSLCEHLPIQPATVWVIGGAQIYAQALAFAHAAEVTEIDTDVDGDAHAPALGPTWVERARSDHATPDGLAYRFVTYVNTAPHDWHPSH